MSMLAVASTLFNTFVLSWFVRRLMGVPVGWPRTILLSLVVGASAGPVVTVYSRLTSIDYRGGTPTASFESVYLILLLVGWILAAEAAMLAILEAVVPTGSVPHPVWVVRNLPAAVRRLVRYLQIVRIAARHGLTSYLGRRTRHQLDNDRQLSQGLVTALGEAGVTFIKLGQNLAARPDLVTPSLAAGLSTLQTDAVPEPWSRLLPVVEESLGRPVGEVFASIDAVPLAAASVAQVHGARLVSGEEVVLKVQRPAARAQVMVDLDIIGRLARRLERSTSWARTIGLCRLVDGFAESLREELDYTVELDNTLSVRSGLERSGSTGVRVPEIFVELSGARLLVMERVPGEPLGRAGDSLDGIDSQSRSLMVDTIVGSVLHQVLVTGVFHADLHAGNLFATRDGQLTMIDFGSVGRLDKPSRTQLAALLLAFQTENTIAATDAFVALLGRPEGLDDRALERDLGEALVRFQNRTGSHGATRVFNDLALVVVRHRFSVPNQVAAALRALGSLEGTLRQLSPEADVFDAARRQQDSIWSMRDRVAEVRQQVAGQLLVAGPVVQRLPRRLDGILSGLETGPFSLRAGSGRGPADGFVTQLLHQFIVAVLAAACALCGILLIITDGASRLTATVPVTSALGATLLLFGFVLAARLLTQIFNRA